MSFAPSRVIVEGDSIAPDEPFACASCVHPSQVPVINEEYGDSPEELDRARRMVAAFEASLAQGIGAVTFEGAMIDEPVVERARRLLARARPA